MGDIIDKNDLFGNEYNAVVLCEYPHEIKLIRDLIDIAECGYMKQKVEGTWSFESICYSFAKTIVDYSKMAYDNLLLGHFYAVNMINRSILENLVFLDIIINHEEKELWKYYIIHSQWNDLHQLKRDPTQKELDLFYEVCKELNIDEDFYTPQGNKKTAYIEKTYGWTYKINNDFSSNGVCSLVNDTEHDIFKVLSRYSHGTSFDLKVQSPVFLGHVIFMLSSLYIGLYRMVTLYCIDTVDDSFDELSEEIENLFYNNLEYNKNTFKL